jgi:hypothetical protein
MNAHLVPFRKASLIASATGPGRLLISPKEPKELEKLVDGGTNPERMSSFMVALTFAFRTVAHCATPTVPPSTRNYSRSRLLNAYTERK